MIIKLKFRLGQQYLFNINTTLHLMKSQFYLQYISMDYYDYQNINFYGNYENFKLTVKYGYRSQILKLKILNTHTFQSFRQNIDMDYIQKRDDFVNLFQSPQQLKDYLATNFDSVQIVDGTIKINYAFGVKVNKLAQQEYTETQLKSMRIQRIKDSFMQKYQEVVSLIDDLQQKDKKYFELQKHYEQLQQQNQYLQKLLEDEEYQNQELQKKLSKAEKRIKELNKYISIIAKKQLSESHEQRGEVRRRGRKIQRGSSHNEQRNANITNWSKIGRIKPGKQNIHLIAKVLQVSGHDEDLLDVLLGDETGTVRALFDNNPVLIEGNMVQIRNSCASVVQEHITLQIMPGGKIAEYIINYNNNVSDKNWVQSPQ